VSLRLRLLAARPTPNMGQPPPARSLSPRHVHTQTCSGVAPSAAIFAAASPFPPEATTSSTGAPAGCGTRVGGGAVARGNDRVAHASKRPARGGVKVTSKASRSGRAERERVSE